MTDLEELLQRWPELTPDPQRMEQVGRQMVAAMAAAPAGSTADEAQFRRLTLLWVAAALAVYLGRSYLAAFFALHPVLVTLLALFGGMCLLAPLLLLTTVTGTAGLPPGPKEAP